MFDGQTVVDAAPFVVVTKQQQFHYRRSIGGSHHQLLIDRRRIIPMSINKDVVVKAHPHQYIAAWLYDE
jgi:hypothetical protein